MPWQLCHGFCFASWCCHNWTKCGINNVSFTARRQQNTPVNHMAAVHGWGTSQIAKETAWRHVEKRSMTTMWCGPVAVTEILITRNNLLIHLHRHAHTLITLKWCGRNLANRKDWDINNYYRKCKLIRFCVSWSTMSYLLTQHQQVSEFVLTCTCFLNPFVSSQLLWGFLKTGRLDSDERKLRADTQTPSTFEAALTFCFGSRRH